MSIITEYVKIIKTAEGKELFKLPIDTLLDRIIPDLWNDMARYRFNYQFIFCDRLNPLGGFRAVKKDEFVSVKSIFSGYYYENKGINIEIKNIEERRAFGAEIMLLLMNITHLIQMENVFCVILWKTIQKLYSGEILLKMGLP